MTRLLSSLAAPLAITLFATLGLTQTGCVGQGVSDKQQELIREKEAQIVQLLARIEELETRIAALRAQSGDAAAAQSEIDRLSALLADARASIAELEGRPPQIVTINPEVESALRQLAERYPGLMTYDSARGMIQLQSDLTFGSGSIEVSEGATTALGQLAGVLNTPEATPYDIRVVGHTDNVPVRQVAGRRFINNWELSVFRAISVKNVIVDGGTAENRVEVAGRGETQPIVANGNDGAQANRRVEIFIVEAAGPRTAPAPTPQPVDEPVVEDMIEDDATFK